MAYTCAAPSCDESACEPVTLWVCDDHFAATPTRGPLTVEDAIRAWRDALEGEP